MLQKNYFLYLLLAVLISLQIPFLQADPDAALTDSRDAATDEGIYSSQIRNYINNDVASLSNVDCTLKTMLFSTILFFSFKIFGTKWIVARLTVLILSFLILFLLCRNKKFRTTGVIFSMLALTNYYIFQYAHFALSEMLSALYILLGVFFIFKNTDELNRKNQVINILFATLFVSFSYYSKVQFVYICPLIPAVFVAEWLFIKHRDSKSILRDFALATGFTALWGILYFVCWYLPFKEIHQKLMAGQELTGILLFNENTVMVMKNNFKYIAFSKTNLLMSLFYLISLAVGTYRFFKTDNYNYKMLFVAANLWVAAECHKWIMPYLPARYLLSLYVSLFTVISIVLSEIIFNWKNQRLTLIAYSFLTLLLLFNGYKYRETYNNREFVIRDANRYLAQYDLKNETALGPWAGSLTWDCKMFSVPVWNHFLNYEAPLKTFKPRIVVSEFDEQDSEQAYQSAGINLKEVSDSSKSFVIRKRWNVIVYWIKKDTLK